MDKEIKHIENISNSIDTLNTNVILIDTEIEIVKLIEEYEFELLRFSNARNVLLSLLLLYGLPLISVGEQKKYRNLEDCDYISSDIVLGNEFKFNLVINSKLKVETLIKDIIHIFIHIYDFYILGLDMSIHTEGFSKRCEILYNTLMLNVHKKLVSNELERAKAQEQELENENLKKKSKKK